MRQVLGINIECITSDSFNSIRNKFGVPKKDFQSNWSVSGQGTFDSWLRRASTRQEVHLVFILTQVTIVFSLLTGV